jgi:hypothetical protein
MRSPLRTPLAAVFRAELLFNTRRVVPYAMMILFAANALMWWGWGPAIGRGWATNSDFYIVRLLGGFSFMTLPLFIAVMMGDPVIRDFRYRIDPLIFSKPVGRAEYLLGKFLGNFFVLVCCEACFVLTLLLLQAFSRQGMLVLPWRAAPYFKHFFFFVIVSSLAQAAVYFAVGTLTRNVKIVYGLAISFYFLYVAWQEGIKGLSLRWRILLDPLLFNVGASEGHDAEWLNQFALPYDADMIANRALMLLASAICLAFLCARFSTAERFKKTRKDDGLTTIELLTKGEWLDSGEEGGFEAASPAYEIEEVKESAAQTRAQKTVALPKVSVVTEGARVGFRQLMAAVEVELRLLFAERSLVVLLPLATLAPVLGLAYYDARPDPSYSAAYAGRTADSFLLFLIAIAVFYTGEAMHRDRELRVEPVLWSVPTPNFVLLVSKFSTTLLLSVSAGALVCAAAVALQIYKGHAPVEVLTYITIYSVILLPSMALMIAAATALNVLLRDKYLAYAACIGVVGGLFYLFSLGYNHALYNPALYGLWSPSDFAGGAARLTYIFTHRVYCLALAVLFLSLAHVFFERRSNKGSRAGGRLSGRRSSILAALVAIAAAVITGLMISNGWRG